MAPATVLGADESPPGTGKPAMQAPAEGTEKPAAGHMKHGSVEGGVAPGRPAAIMHKQEKIERPEASFHKGESPPDSAGQKQNKPSTPGGATWDLATMKK
jgi:hypothetical protein